MRQSSFKQVDRDVRLICDGFFNFGHYAIDYITNYSFRMKLLIILRYIKRSRFYTLRLNQEIRQVVSQKLRHTKHKFPKRPQLNDKISRHSLQIKARSLERQLQTNLALD